MQENEMKFDPVENPRHYVIASTIVEPIELLRHAPFDFGNAMKYVLRADFKGNRLEDLKKALWYLECAEESRNYDNEPYDAFFERYGSLFNRFFPRLENKDGVEEKPFMFIRALYALMRYVKREIMLEELRLGEKENG